MRKGRAKPADMLRVSDEDSTKEALLNLLAVIHRDGGHYVAKHGIEKAAADAEHLIAKERAVRDSEKGEATPAKIATGGESVEQEQNKAARQSQSAAGYECSSAQK